MFTALLLPLLAASPVAANSVVQADDPAIQLWISNDRRFYQGDRPLVQLRTRDDGYVVVLHADPDGHVRVLIPVDPKEDNFVRGGRKYDVKGRNAREPFSIEVSSGRGTVYAAYSATPFRFDQYVLGDHWDYKTLAPNILPTNPESELTDIVRSMATASFDYDILNYDVLGGAYADNSYSGSSSDYYGSGYYSSSWCCGFSFGISFGTPYYYPHHHYGYNPYYYGYYPYGYYPAYSPFLYNPYWWPAYYYPYAPYYGYGYYRPYYPYSGYRPYYGYGYGNRPGYGHGYVTPYRYRGNTAIAGDYRPYTLRRTVNTAHYGPTTRVRELGNVSSPRRSVDNRVAGSPTNLSDRRQISRSGATGMKAGRSPTSARNVTARRAGESGRSATQTPWPVQVGPGARRSVDRGQSGAESARSGAVSVADRGEPSVNRREIVARRSVERQPTAGRGELGTGMSGRGGMDARRSLDRSSVSAASGRDIQARSARELSRSEGVRSDPRSYGPEMSGGRSLDRGPSPSSSARGGDAGPRPSGGGSYNGGGSSGRGTSSPGGAYRGGGGGGGAGGGMRRR
jgi:hypothetical protein